MSKLHVLLAVNLNDERLQEYKLELLDAGEPLYTEDPVVGPVRLWPGEPSEWASIMDLVDLAASPARAIESTEILEVREAPASSSSSPRWWEVWR